MTFLLIRIIEQFLRETGMPWSTFGRLATNDPRFVQDLRNDRVARPATRTKVESFMQKFRDHLNADY